MDSSKLIEFSDTFWENHIIPTLSRYIEIPVTSPGFDSEWETNGLMAEAHQLAEGWIKEHLPKGASLISHSEPGRTPLLIIDVPGEVDKNVLMYGHLDKQPEMQGWDDDLGPWKAVRKGDKLYGRGASDDGYALFTSLASIKALEEQGVSYPSCRILIEFCEESGSLDLPFYLEKFKSEIGTPDLIVCLDSGCGNYDQVWQTTSLRGNASGTLKVEILTEGVHSGDASGVVPSSFRILRQLLSRLEDEKSGEVIASFQVDIPKERLTQAAAAGEVLQKNIYQRFPFVDGGQPVGDNVTDNILDRTWRAALSITGMDGLPEPAKAGNVLRPFTTAKLSLRLPPTADGLVATNQMKEILENDPPYGAKVTFTADEPGSGWNAPVLTADLEQSIQQGSQLFYELPALSMGEGGSIPLMKELGDLFPRAQFFITGVLGPGANAHGPNEFLHIEFVKKLTCVVSHVLGNFK